MTMERLGCSQSEKLKALSAKTSAAEKQEKELLREWYKMFFEVIDGIPVQSLGTEVYFKDKIEPWIKEMGEFDYYPLDWLVTQFYAESNVSIQCKNAEKDYESIKKTTISFRSRKENELRAKIFISAKTEKSDDSPHTSYSMFVKKICDFKVDGKAENYDEFDDPYKVSEANLLQISCAIAQAYSQELTQMQNKT